jgi:putative addiction module component (TIGR02574 family)
VEASIWHILEYCDIFRVMKITAADALELSVPERIQLVIEIWDSIAECPEQIELTDATRQLLRKRLAAYRENPDAGSPWEDVKRRILNG